MQRQPTGIIHDRKKNLGADPCAGTRTASKREMAFVECPGNEVLARDKELELRQEDWLRESGPLFPLVTSFESEVALAVAAVGLQHVIGSTFP